MDLTEDDVIQILQLMGESDFDELQLEVGDLKLVVNKRNGAAPLETREHQELAQDPVSDFSDDQAEAQTDRETVVVEAGLDPINAPMLGIFYRAPKPDAPPFVEVGSMVEEDTTVCIIEVMKLFTTIKAGRRGRIARIYPENGALVEYDQVLFAVEPELA